MTDKNNDVQNNKQEAKNVEAPQILNAEEYFDQLEQQIEDNNNFEIKLENYEGPLDLLLDIIKKHKMDIEDLHLKDLTEQYLLYMEQLDSHFMENASEFIEVAAQLIEIKSKSILPVEQEEEEVVDDLELNLIARLKEKKLLLEASEKLADQEELDKLYKKPDKMAGNVKIVLKDMQLENMLDAFAKMMAIIPKKIELQKPRHIEKDRFTVADRIFTIKNIIFERKMMKFTEFFDEDLTKSELINSFLALLELLKHQFIKVVQSEVFSCIDIICNQEKYTEEESLNVEIETDY